MLAPAIIVLLAGIAGNLAWITISGEEAPDLVGTAPDDGRVVGYGADSFRLHRTLIRLVATRQRHELSVPASQI